MLCNNSLVNFYKTNFNLMYYHKFSLTELENMLPWEYEVYVGMLAEEVRQENERIEQRNKK